MVNHSKIFFARTASTLALWVAVIAAIASGIRPICYGVISIFGLLAYWEYLRMLNFQSRAGMHNRWISLVFAGVFLAAGFTAREFSMEASLLTQSLVFFGFVSALFLRTFFTEIRGRETFSEIAEAVFGFVYVIGLFSFVGQLLWVDGKGEGFLYVFFCLLVTKFSDMGAYLVGSWVGKHKMIPHISPGKSWEGFFGGVLFAVLGALAVFYLFNSHFSALTLVHTVILGLLLALAAFIGDLAESVLKRSLGSKDSGAMLPGIGGVLDLIDSVLIAGPVLFFYLIAL